MTCLRTSTHHREAFITFSLHSAVACFFAFIYRVPNLNDGDNNENAKELSGAGGRM
jgi:hypothetical protein